MDQSLERPIPDGVSAKSYVKRAILSLDGMLARLNLVLTREQGALLIFLFHGLFQNRDEIANRVMDPQQGITVNMLRTFV